MCKKTEVTQEVQRNKVKRKNHNTPREVVEQHTHKDCAAVVHGRGQAFLTGLQAAANTEQQR